MQEPNWYTIFVAALFPLILGSIWYNPKILGNVWMKSAGISEPTAEENKGMWKTYLIVYLFGVLFSWIMVNLSVHQMGAIGMIGGDPAKAGASFMPFMTEYGGAFRTFGHGALHGGLGALFISLFVLGSSALFERRSWTYILVHVGYHTLCGLLMGGFLCWKF